MPHGSYRPKRAAAPPVLIATDLEDDASDAMRHGHAWSAATAVDVIVCHAVSPWLGALVGHAQATKVITERYRALTADADADIRVILPSGSPHVAVLEVADREKPALIVVGASGAGSIERVVRTSTAEEIARYARCSVLVSRSSSTRGPVVVGTDFSQPGQHAVREACMLAEQRNVEVIAIHSLYSPRSPLMALGALFAERPDNDALKEERTSKLEATLREHGASGTCAVTTGRPGQALATLAAEVNASFVVVGPSGTSDQDRIFLGTEALTVLRNANCSVLIARE